MSIPWYAGAMAESATKLQRMLAMDDEERTREEVQILEGLMAGAIKANKFAEAAAIFDKVRAICKRPRTK